MQSHSPMVSRFGLLSEAYILSFIELFVQEACTEHLDWTDGPEKNRYWSNQVAKAVPRVNWMATRKSATASQREEVNPLDGGSLPPQPPEGLPSNCLWTEGREGKAMPTGLLLDRLCPYREYDLPETSWVSANYPCGKLEVLMQSYSSHRIVGHFDFSLMRSKPAVTTQSVHRSLSGSKNLLLMPPMIPAHLPFLSFSPNEVS